MRGANLSGADVRSAALQGASLNSAIVSGIKLWETQRADWSIKGIICDRAYWDKDGKTPTFYAPGEFERLHSDQTCIELFYLGGVSTFELNTLPALLHHLASLHPGASIRLKSVEETGGGAKISISVGDADTETTEKIKADAMQVYQAQLALREDELNREKIEKKYLEKLLFGGLIPAMLSAGAPQNVFNAPVTGVAIASGESKVDFHQTVNDNSAILALLERIMDRRGDIGLSTEETAELEHEFQSTKAELDKETPDKRIVSKSLEFFKKIAVETAKKAAGKFEDKVVSGDWQAWLHQLNQLIHHWK
jgi:Ser-tRNA(Ala) deacylase AlaX